MRTEFYLCGRHFAASISLTDEGFSRFWSSFDFQVIGSQSELYRINSVLCYTLEYCIDFSRTDVEHAIQTVSMSGHAKHPRTYLKVLPASAKNNAPPDFEGKIHRFEEMMKEARQDIPNCYVGEYVAITDVLDRIVQASQTESVSA